MRVRTVVNWFRIKVGACDAEEMESLWLGRPRGGGKLTSLRLMSCIEDVVNGRLVGAHRSVTHSFDYSSANTGHKAFEAL